MTSGDWLPAQAPFDLVRRGYSPDQVTAHLERLEYDLRITTANRDATNQRLSELGAQLSAAQAEADALRAQLDRSALEPVSMSGLSDRMQRMIRLAEEEASEIRARAEADSSKLRTQLEASLAEAAQARATFDAERERTRKQLAEQVHGLLGEATAEAGATRTAAQQESARLLAEANAEAERTVAEARRYAEQTVGEANQTAETLTSTSQAEAAAVLLAARTSADALTEASRQERERLDAEGLARRTGVDEDFEITIAARRAEAAKTIADREAASTATARQLVADATAQSEKLVADATAYADKLVADATAESELLMQRATTYAKALVNRAAAESHQRVADADQAVGSLLDLRARIVDQLTSLGGHLDHIRELAGSAPAFVAVQPDEAGRVRTEQFPVDPQDRPTDVPLPVPVLETGPAVPTDDGAGVETAVEADGSRADDSTGGAVDGPATDESAEVRPAADGVDEPAAAPEVNGANGSEQHPDHPEPAGPQAGRLRTFGPGRSRR